MLSIAAIIAAANAINSIAHLVPVVVDIVDKAAPEGTPGRLKLDMFEATIKALVAGEDALVQSIESAWPTLAALVGAVVTAKKTVAAAATPAAPAAS